MSAPGGSRIVVAGLGGQGVIFVTRLLAEAAIGQGWRALSSETHGMAQRGGSVAASLAIGSFQCALALPGTASLLLALDRGEAARNLAFLGRGAQCLVSAPEPWTPEARQAAAAHGIGLHAVDAASIALGLGAPFLANVALLGALAAFPFSPVPRAALEDALRRRGPDGRQGVNRAAFEAGLEAGARARSGPEGE